MNKLAEWRLERVYDVSSSFLYRIIRHSKWGEVTHGYIRRDWTYEPKDLREITFRTQSNYPLSQIPKTLLPKKTRLAENY